MDELTRLLRDAAAGDRLALSTFIRRTQADVWRFCAHLVDPGAADDLTQEVYLRAMRTAPRFRGDASARTWLLTIARCVAADEIRARQRGRVRGLSDAAVGLDALEGREPADPDHTEVHALSALVDGLDPERREAFVLTQLLGLSYAEAAAAAEVPVGTIRSRVARARGQLIGALDAADGRGEDRADGEA